MRAIPPVQAKKRVASNAAGDLQSRTLAQALQIPPHGARTRTPATNGLQCAMRNWTEMPGLKYLPAVRLLLAPNTCGKPGEQGRLKACARLHSPRGIDATSHRCVALQKTE